jgi:inosine-uridine nucleoside N-ribohydrolase
MRLVVRATLAVVVGLILVGSVYTHSSHSSVLPNEVPELERVIIDVDHAIDDTFALAVALRSPELQIVGITIAPHPEARLQARFVARLLRELGLESIPISIGSGLLTNSCTCGHWQPISDQLGVDYPAPIEESAAQFIVREANATPGKVSLVTLGPLTNLADALRDDPSIAEKISRVVMLAGGGPHGNNSCHEYNVSTDVASAQRVFASGIPILMVGVDVSYKAHLSRETIALALSEPDRFSQDMLTYWRANGAGALLGHDLLAVAAAVDEKLLQWTQGSGAITADGCLSFNSSPNGSLGVARAVDASAFQQFVINRLRDSTTAHGPLDAATLASAVVTVVPSPHAVRRQKVILDMEYIVDDFFALAVALRSPEIDVVGVTLVPHREAREEVRAVAALLHSAGRDDIPLAIGEQSAYPLYKGGKWGEDDEIGLDTWGVNAPTPLTESAPDFIVRKANAEPDEILMLTVGTLTNLGDALQRDPSIARKLRGVVMMGGSITKGYDFTDNPSQEHNVADDVPAARRVFASGLPVLMVGLDATANLRLDLGQLSNLENDAPMSSIFLRERFNRYPAITPFDVMTVAMAIDRSFSEVRRGHVEIANNGFTRLVPNAPVNVEYCVNPNVTAFNEFMLARLGVATTTAARH